MNDVRCPDCGRDHLRAFRVPSGCNPVFVCVQRLGGCGLVFSPARVAQAVR